MNLTLEILSSLIMFFSIAVLFITFKKTEFVLLISVIFNLIMFVFVPEHALLSWNIFFVIYFVLGYCIYKKTMNENLTTVEMLQKNRIVFYSSSGYGIGWLLGNFIFAMIEKGSYTMTDVNLPMHTGVVFCFLVSLYLDMTLKNISKKNKKDEIESKKEIIDIKVKYKTTETHSCGSQMRTFGNTVKEQTENNDKADQHLEKNVDSNIEKVKTKNKIFKF